MTSDWMRRGATALAVGRTAIGVAALARPSLIARPWVGEAGGPAPQVLGRALGSRDLALGLGALAALSRVPLSRVPLSRVPPGAAGRAGAWVGAGALADSLDVLATAAAWDELPRAGRWLVAMSAGGAAVAGAAAAWSLLAAAAADGT
jgi:hypothetical protein